MRQQHAEMFRSYVDVVNRALDAHKDEMFYGKMIEVGRDALDGKAIRVEVYDEDPAKVVDTETLAMGKDGLTLDADGDVSLTWKIPLEHIREVNNDPAVYVNQPSRLNLDWLASRIGIA